jgi:hypothetical protein
LESNHCPECGREFDPANHKTFFPAFSLPAWALRFLRPRNWPARLAAYLMVLVFVVDGIFMLPIAAGLAIWLGCYCLIAIPWIIYRIGGAFSVRRYLLDRDVLRASDPSIRRARKILYAGLLLTLFPIAQILTFSIEIFALDGEARQCLTGPTVPTHCGPTPIYDMECVDGGVYFGLGCYRASFRPDGPTRTYSEYIPFYGPWSISFEQ